MAVACLLKSAPAEVLRAMLPALTTSPALTQSLLTKCLSPFRPLPQNTINRLATGMYVNNRNIFLTVLEAVGLWLGFWCDFSSVVQRVDFLTYPHREERDQKPSLDPFHKGTKSQSPGSALLTWLPPKGPASKYHYIGDGDFNMGA